MVSKLRSVGAVCLLAASLGILGCSKDAHPKTATDVAPPADDTAGIPAMTTAMSPKPEGDSVVIPPDIRDRCGIPSASDAPKFAYDSALLEVEGIRTLNALASCLTEGPLHGEKIMLTGRADPRGPDDYNMNLGEQRAEAVARHLESRGVPEGSITAHSRGELDAKGYDEASWAFDRRVDVELTSGGG